MAFSTFTAPVSIQLSEELMSNEQVDFYSLIQNALIGSIVFWGIPQNHQEICNVGVISGKNGLHKIPGFNQSRKISFKQCYATKVSDQG